MHTFYWFYFLLALTLVWKRLENVTLKWNRFDKCITVSVTEGLHDTYAFLKFYAYLYHNTYYPKY